MRFVACFLLGMALLGLGAWLGFRAGYRLTRKAVERSLRHGRLQIGRTEYVVRWQVTGPPGRPNRKSSIANRK